MKNVIAELRISIIVLALLASILCGVYPMLVWGLSQTLFPHKANGSLIILDGKPVGSMLLGQRFIDPKYFQPRPSFAGTGYDASFSGGSNLGPTSRKLIDLVSLRVNNYRKENGLGREVPVPGDAVTASASGLDPHISLENAIIQAGRVAKMRSLSERQVTDIIHRYASEPDFGFLGQKRVNVLRLNLILDGKLWD